MRLLALKWVKLLKASFMTIANIRHAFTAIGIMIGKTVDLKKKKVHSIILMERAASLKVERVQYEGKFVRGKHRHEQHSNCGCIT